MLIRKFNDLIQASQKLTTSLAESINSKIEARKIATIALSGGHSSSYYLSQLAYQNIDWNWVHIFWIYEELVSPASNHSNFALAQQYLFDKITIPGSNIHRVKGELKDKAADDYKEDLKKIFKGKIEFDVVLMGMEESGYLAPVDSRKNGPLLSGRNNLVLHESPVVKAGKRLSLSLNVINKAKKIILFVEGEDKKQKFEDFLKALNLPSPEEKTPEFDLSKIEIFTDINVIG